MGQQRAWFGNDGNPRLETKQMTKLTEKQQQEREIREEELDPAPCTHCLTRQDLHISIFYSQIMSSWIQLVVEKCLNGTEPFEWHMLEKKCHRTSSVERHHATLNVVCNSDTEDTYRHNYFVLCDHTLIQKLADQNHFKSLGFAFICTTEIYAVKSFIVFQWPVIKLKLNSAQPWNNWSKLAKVFIFNHFHLTNMSFYGWTVAWTCI